MAKVKVTKRKTNEFTDEQYALAVARMTTAVYCTFREHVWGSILPRPRQLLFAGLASTLTWIASGKLEHEDVANAVRKMLLTTSASPESGSEDPEEKEFAELLHFVWALECNIIVKVQGHELGSAIEFSKSIYPQVANEVAYLFTSLTQEQKDDTNELITDLMQDEELMDYVNSLAFSA